jgi:TatD DNase family protein
MARSYPAGFDAHTHLDDPAFDADRDAVCARAHGAGVGGLAIAAADPADWARAQAVAARIGASLALGVHPWFADAATAAVLDALAAAEVDAVGEIGLDALRGPDAPTQERALRAQLAVARARELPVVLHAVRAVDRVLAILRRDGLPRAGGLLHGFEGSAAQARAAVAAGLCVGIGPSVTRPSARRAEAIRAIPAARLCLETDAPSRPVPGATRGEPAHLVDVAAAVASIRGEPAADVLSRSGDVARALFRREPSAGG